jgi:hypothetical protein
MDTIAPRMPVAAAQIDVRRTGELAGKPVPAR